MENPWVAQEELYLENFEDFKSSYHVTGIKIGDVNITQTEKRSNDMSVLKYRLRTDDKTSEQILDFYFEEEEEFKALQLNFLVRNSNLKLIRSGQLELSDADFNIIDSHELRISQNFEEEVSFDADQALFSLVVDFEGTVNQLTMLQDVVINSELYHGANEVSSIALKADDQPLSANSLTVYPNPFSQQLFVKFDLEVEQQVSIEIFDLNGRRLYDHAETLTAGQTTMKLDKIPHLNSSSLLISRVLIGDKVFTNKIMQVEE